MTREMLVVLTAVEVDDALAMGGERDLALIRVASRRSWGPARRDLDTGVLILSDRGVTIVVYRSSPGARARDERTVHLTADAAGAHVVVAAKMFNDRAVLFEGWAGREEIESCRISGAKDLAGQPRYRPLALSRLFPMADLANMLVAARASVAPSPSPPPSSPSSGWLF